MKTLREYIDRLDEISRRDFLKGAGLAAAGAALSKSSYAHGKKNKNFDDPRVQYLLGWTIIVSNGFNTWVPSAFPNVPWQDIKDIQNQIALLRAESEGEEIDFNPTKYANLDLLMKSRRNGYADANEYIKQSTVRGPKGVTEQSLIDQYNRLKLYFNRLNQILNTAQ